MSALALDALQLERSTRRTTTARAIVQEYVDAAQELLARDHLAFTMEFDLADCTCSTHPRQALM